MTNLPAVRCSRISHQRVRRQLLVALAVSMGLAMPGRAETSDGKVASGSDGTAPPTMVAAAPAGERPTVQLSSLWGFALGLDATARQFLGPVLLDGHVMAAFFAPLGITTGGAAPSSTPFWPQSTAGMRTQSAVPVAIFPPAMLPLYFASGMVDVGVNGGYAIDIAPGWRLRPNLGVSLAHSGSFSFDGSPWGLVPRYGMALAWQPADRVQCEVQVEARHGFALGNSSTLGLFPGAHLNLQLAETQLGLDFFGAPGFAWGETAGTWYSILALRYGYTWRF